MHVMAPTTTLAAPGTAGSGATARRTSALARPAARAGLSVAVVTALGALLRVASFDRVRINPFYDAAVRSMGQSWHNFFFGAYEPSGQVSVDKIPVDLWLQVASTKLLGFGSVALRLPELVAGTLAIPLMYFLVRRLFGHRAGLIAAAALAVLPISVVTARSDTMDSVMMLCLVGAALLIVRAGQERRTGPLIGAGAVLGLAFNVKLFEVVVALPAMAVLAVLILDRSWPRRILQLALAAVTFAAVSLSWLVAVLLTPAAGRPFPIGSTNGSAWNVVFVFNGLSRLNKPPSAAQAALDPTGPTRLFTTSGIMHGRLIGSALVAAFVLGAVALALVAWRRLRGDAPEPVSDDEARSHRAGAVFLGVWLVVGFAVLSRMGNLHPRYEEAFTPAVAGTIGVSLAWLSAGARRERAALVALAAAVVAVAALAPGIGATTWPPGLLALAAALAFGLGARVARARAAVLLAVGAVAVLAVPAAGAIHLVRAGASSAGQPGHAPAATVTALSTYLRAHQGTARYEVASTSVAKAGPLIVRDGRPVLMLTSLYDRPLLTAGALAAKVAHGDVRYVLLGRGTCARTCSAPVLWARDNGVDVSRAAGQRTGTVYRLDARATHAARG
jgi:4-amino-4-deoxy-L-arabinose transferase-like glycosyltransferase